jgi:hypothetical protein
MKVELEARYYGIDEAKVIDYLDNHKMDGICYMREADIKRVVYDINPEKRIFLRVREYHRKTEISVKEIRDSKSIRGIDELSIECQGRKMDKFQELFEAIGLGKGSYQETERSGWSFRHKDWKNESAYAYITIDYWPGLKPVLEVEGTKEYARKFDVYQKQLEEILGLPERFKGDIADIYTLEYGISRADLSALPRLTESVTYSWNKVK